MNDKHNRLFWFLNIVLLSFILVTVIQNWIRVPASGWFTKCSSNVKNLGTALEMYASENDMKYPPDMSYLIPDYLEEMPVCVAADRKYVFDFLRSWESGRDTYSKSYRVSKDWKRYTFYCEGENHKGVGIESGNWPQYNSEEGIRARP